VKVATLKADPLLKDAIAVFALPSFPDAQREIPLNITFGTAFNFITFASFNYAGGNF
jgi:hypothetical protein